MATLYICEFEDATQTANGIPLAEHVVTVSGLTTQSAAINTPTGAARNRTVRLWTDTECYVTWGANPTATTDGTSGRPLGVKNPEYVQIKGGDKIAVIQRS